VPARIGIAALNLLWPGLGLLRLQRPKAGMRLLVAPFVLTLLMLAAYALLPVFTFRIWIAVVLFSLLVGLGVYVAAILLSWRASAIRLPNLPWWARWYGLTAIGMGCFAAYWPAPDVLASYYKAFYLPAESMEPTLLKGDRLLAHMRSPWDLRRGRLILVSTPRGHIYIKRIAAVGGDRIAMRDGIVILNGRPVPQRLLERVQGQHPWGEPATISRLAEQFPGESRSHQILDSGVTAFDDMPEQRVAPGHLFLLGDNRDHSADSRVPIAEMGLEQVPISAIRGQPLFHYWGSDNSRMGEPLNR
jgi:signal peptidase I